MPLMTCMFRSEYNTYILGTVPRSPTEVTEAKRIYNGYIPGQTPKESQIKDATCCAIDSLKRYQVIYTKLQPVKSPMAELLKQLITEAESLNGKFHPLSAEAQLLLHFTTYAGVLFSITEDKASIDRPNAARDMLKAIDEMLSEPREMSEFTAMVLTLVAVCLVCSTLELTLPLAGTLAITFFITALAIASIGILILSQRLSDFEDSCQFFAEAIVEGNSQDTIYFAKKDDPVPMFLPDVNLESGLSFKC